MPSPYWKALSAGGGLVGRIVVKTALRKLGGHADLQALYREIEGNSSTRTQFWREHAGWLRHVAPGRYALVAAANDEPQILAAD